MLKINNIDVSYGPIKALHGVSIEVGENEIVSMIGANGAGKSTLMKTILGLCKTQCGDILFGGKRLDTMQTHQIVRRGVIYVPEGRKIIANMTVMENLEMGAYSRSIPRKVLLQSMEEAFEIFPRLKERRKQQGGTLSGGEQQMLAIARGLMAAPKLLMLDEPSMGLAPIIVDEVFEVIKRINESQKLPILLVEQNAFMALSVSTMSYVLENGAVTLKGDSHTLMNSEEVKKSYLGG